MKVQTVLYTSRDAAMDTSGNSPVFSTVSLFGNDSYKGGNLSFIVINFLSRCNFDVSWSQ